MNKSLIYVGAGVGGLVGGWLGSLLDHSLFGVWGVLLSAVGGIAGIYAAYKIQQ